MTQTTSPLDSPKIQQQITDWINQGALNAWIVRHLATEYDIVTSEAAVRRFKKRHNLQFPQGRPGTVIKGDTATVNSGKRLKDEQPVGDPDRMMRDHGLDPEEWYIEQISLNEWEGPSADGPAIYCQVKFIAKRRRPNGLLQPVRSEGWRPRVTPEFRRASNSAEPHSKLIVVCGDQQAPFQDHGLHDAFLHWLARNQPDMGIINGDLVDFPDISRHPSDPDNDPGVQECLQAGHEIVRDYVAASPDTEWIYMDGNHDIRLKRYVIDKAPYLYNLHRAEVEGEDTVFAHSLGWLMRFDELGIKTVTTNGPYEDAQVVLSDNLVVRHGWVVRSGSGASALKTLEQTHHSIVINHTHRASIVFATNHDTDRTSHTSVAVESGCMCRLDNKMDEQSRRFPSYGVYPDWQQGFSVIHLHPDGKFHASLANYVDKTLLWNGQRFEGKVHV